MQSEKESIQCSEIKSDDNHVSDTFDTRFTEQKCFELYNASNHKDQSKNPKDLSDDIEMDPLDSKRNELNASRQKEHFEEVSIEEFKVETLEFEPVDQVNSTVNIVSFKTVRPDDLKNQDDTNEKSAKDSENFQRGTKKKKTKCPVQQ